MAMGRTAAELKKLEEQRAGLVKLEAAGKGGPTAQLMRQLEELDTRIAGMMGVTVDQLGKMRKR